MSIIVTLRFDQIDDTDEIDGNAFSSWIDGTFDNADYSEDVGFPSAVLEECRPWVESITKRED